MSNNSFWITLWIVIASSIIGTVTICTKHCREKDRMMIEAGYTYEFVAGQQGQQWVKKEPK